MYHPDDQNKLIVYYDDLLASHGKESAHAVGWNSDESRDIRFKVLCEVGDLNNHSVLDVGCGLGDLYKTLQEKTWGGAYTGIDINPEMIAAARKKYPGIRALVAECAEYTEPHDFVLCSGALNLKIEDAENTYFGLVAHMFSLAKIGVAFNMLNREYHVDDDVFASFPVQEVEKYCLTLTDNVRIRQDYLPHDFTVYLYH